MEDRCAFLDCQKMSHLAGLPYDPPMTVFEHPVFPKGTLVQMGGDGDHLGHVTDQAKVWKEMLKFVNSVSPSNHS